MTNNIESIERFREGLRRRDNNFLLRSRDSLTSRIDEILAKVGDGSWDANRLQRRFVALMNAQTNVRSVLKERRIV